MQAKFIISVIYKPWSISRSITIQKWHQYQNQSYRLSDYTIDIDKFKTRNKALDYQINVKKIAFGNKEHPTD